MNNLKIPATIPNILAITDFVEEILDENGCAPKAKMAILVAIDEIVNNIATYAYGDSSGDVTVSISVTDGTAELSFTDNGIPFDPLSGDEPDLSKTAESDSVGGLGIFMVKKMMDETAYRRVDGQNIFIIRKRITEGGAETV